MVLSVAPSGLASRAQTRPALTRIGLPRLARQLVVSRKALAAPADPLAFTVRPGLPGFPPRGPLRLPRTAWPACFQPRRRTRCADEASNRAPVQPGDQAFVGLAVAG